MLTEIIFISMRDLEIITFWGGLTEVTLMLGKVESFFFTLFFHFHPSHVSCTFGSGLEHIWAKVTAESGVLFKRGQFNNSGHH